MSESQDASGGGSFALRVKHILRLKISAKILIYFLVIALVPLVVVSYVLVSAAHDQLLADASAKQQAVAADLARRVDNYLAADVNQLAYQARLYSTGNFDSSQMDQNLGTLFNQSARLESITVQTAEGRRQDFYIDGTNVQTNNCPKRVLAIYDMKVAVESCNLDPTNAKAIEFLKDRPYLISPGRNEKNRPHVLVAVPILKNYDTRENKLFSSPSGSATDIVGAVIAYYDVSDMWQSVLSVKIGDSGYAYVVDAQGHLVSHPNKNFLDSHPLLNDTQAVRQFMDNRTATQQTVSETGADVISTPHKTLTGWAVIVEEPVSSIYASINSYIQLAATIGISAIVLSILAGIFFSRQLIRPIKKLSHGARRMERGDFDQEINVGTKDELQDLADTFNSMARGIKRLISDLQDNNMKLKFEQIKLNNIISSVSDGVVAVNGKGEIVSINPPAASLIGKVPKALEGKLMSDMFPWQHEEEPFMPDLKNGGIYRYADLTLNRGDSVTYVDLMVAVLQHQDSDVAAIITIHDQSASRELSFMKLDFVAIAAHELRTPLTVVRGYLDMLSTGAKEELSQLNFESLQKAIVGADQLRSLINKLLNIARIERGDMEIFLEKLNLTKMVGENVEQHLSVAEQKKQHLTFDADTDDDVYVPADPASIVEVLNNLIGNALKYTPKDGLVTVKLHTDKDQVRVEVVDNGPGVPEELRDRLFTKFYRAERSLIAGTRGTGLGLFISKTIIELQNGTIGIDPDKGKGKGSTFYFTLPIYDSDRDDTIIAKKSSGGIRGWFKKHTGN
jgi:signal transduction histidine kinase